MQKYRIINRQLIYSFLVLIVGLSSCKKDGFYTGADAKLEFFSNGKATNMITFDTVFTSINTITKILKVRNPHKSDIKTDVVLIGGATSYFSINVNGVSARQLKDVEIPAQDSIYIFIKANINPSGENNPLLACDTITFLTNGNRQNVELLAHGQDAHFFIPNAALQMPDGSELPYRIVVGEGQEVRWTNDKPYVIYGYAVVDSDAKLIIEKGARVHFHKKGGLWVYIDGCLEVNGTKDEPVTFQGDRLDSWYDADYKQWDRIWICESNRDNKIDYAIIKNAFVGIQAETMESKRNNKLTISNTIIKSCEIGLLSKTYTIDAYNNVFSNCISYCIGLTQGGNYTFTNNTIYNQYVNRRTAPALYLSNYYENIVSDFSGTFVNNIISGNINSDNGREFDCDYVNEAAFSATFENCLIRTTPNRLTSPISEINTLLNQAPLFKSEKLEGYDFNLQANSPCKKAGKYIPWLTTDIENNARNNPPSIGAYE